MTQKQLFALAVSAIMTLICIGMYNPLWVAILLMGTTGLVSFGFIVYGIWGLCGIYGVDSR